MSVPIRDTRSPSNQETTRPDAASQGAIARRARPGIAALLAALFLSGCSLFSVNVKNDEESTCRLDGRNQNNGNTETLPNLDKCSVDAALKYSASWRSVLLKAAGQHSIARNSNAIVAFPASAVALFYGLTGHGSTDRISRLSVGAATYYSATSFLAPTGKQRAYLEGALALSCLIESGIDSRTSEERLNALQQAIARVSDDVQALDTAVSSSIPELEGATRDRAAVVLADAANQLSASRTLRDQLNNMGLRIGVATDRIVVQTAQLVSSQESGLASLLATAGALRSTATSFGLSALPPPEELVSDSGDDDDSDTQAIKASAARSKIISDTEELIAALRTSVASLKTATDDLRPHTDMSDRLALCTPSSTFTGFRVSPEAPAQTVQVGKSITFHITNTQSNSYPTWSTSGNQIDAVKVDGPKVDQGRLVIQVTGEKPTGTTGVGFTILDPTGTISKRYTVVVIAEPPATTDEPREQGDSRPEALAAPMTSTLDETVIRMLQCHLGLVDAQNDGKFGPITYQALRNHASKHQINLGRALTMQIVDAVVASGSDSCSDAAVTDQSASTTPND